MSTPAVVSVTRQKVKDEAADFEEMYDCGVDFDDQIQRAEVTYDCNGSVRCIGDECAKTEYSASDGFARASALLNAAQFMGQDLECTGLDPKGNPAGDVDVHCRIFAGTAKNCAVSMKGQTAVTIPAA